MRSFGDSNGRLFENYRKFWFQKLLFTEEKPIIVPDDILKNYLNEEEIQQYKDSTTRIYSITVYAEKVVGCCTPNSGLLLNYFF